MKQILIPSAEALPEAAQEFLGLMDDATVYAFDGEMGAGKTTFINALSRALGVEDDPTGSPTFSIVNEYRSAPLPNSSITSTSTASRISSRPLT